MREPTLVDDPPVSDDTAGLFRLMYISRNEIVGGRDRIVREVADILLASRRNNARIGVTGLLVASADAFMQTLEGREDVVWRLYDHIDQDPRHSNAVVMEAAPIDCRSFADWSMGFSGFVNDERARFEELKRLGEAADPTQKIQDLVAALDLSPDGGGS